MVAAFFFLFFFFSPLPQALYRYHPVEKASASVQQGQDATRPVYIEKRHLCNIAMIRRRTNRAQACRQQGRHGCLGL
ncbi:hypothetical protein IWX48DRAFT_599094 [Phyllosticta citricarpa]